MSLKAHQADYKPAAWKEYTVEELTWWVRLLCKRAGHRDNPEKRHKDLYDAGNYLSMLREAAKEDATTVEPFMAMEQFYTAVKAELP
jgi:hypothetical protein